MIPDHDIRRIVARIDSSGGIDACWPWTGAKCSGGYGRVSCKYGDTRVHRIIYRIATRTTPGEAVLHECDNPACCNPLHLTSGTIAENNRQAAIRRRMPSGERHPRARLSDQQVADIRRRLQSGERQCDLAREYQVHQSHVCKIAARKVRNQEG